MLIVVPEYRLWIKFHPLGALSIAAVMREAGADVEFLDGGILKTNLFEAVKSSIGRHSMVGISANISHAYSAIQLAAMIREEFPEKIIVWGGAFATIEYEKLLPLHADVVVLGEGEIQAVALAKNVPFADIPGIAYWDNSEKRIFVNSRPDYIQDLDSLPFPALDLTCDLSYTVPGRRSTYSIITERGCPYHCVNCTKVIHGNRFRTRSAANVIKELEILVDRFNAKEIHVWDDNFTLNPERAKEICRKIIAHGLHEKLRFALPNGIRADINDEELFDLMRDANFYFAFVAVESADQNVINSLEKGLDLAKVEATVNALVQRGFRIGLFFMMGLPFDSIASLRQNAKFAASLPAHHAFFWRVTPFPGTKLYDISVGAEKSTTTSYLEDFISYDRPSGRSANRDIPPRTLSYHIWRAHLIFYISRWRLLRILSKFIEEKNLISDLTFLVKCGVKLIFTGHR